MSIILIILGFFFGKSFLFRPRPKKIFYFLQEGVYSKKENITMNKQTPKIIVQNNNRYYTYIGITSKKNIATKLLRIYKNMGYQVDIKEKYDVSEEFSSNLEQYDLLLNATDDKDEILTIEEVVLANYEEMKKSSSKKIKLANNNKGK